MSQGEPWTRQAEDAADLALGAGHDHAAVVFLHELLTAVEHPPDRLIELARKLGEAAAWGSAALGDLSERVIEALRDVLSSDAPAADRGEIRLLLGRLLIQFGEFDRAATEIEAAVNDLDTRPDLAARAMTSLAFPRGHDWPASRHRAWLDKAADVATRVTSAEVRTYLAVDQASALLMLGDDAGWQLADQIGESMDAAGLPERRQAARGLMNLGHMAIAWGRYNEARQRLDQAVELMRTTRYERLLNSAELTRSYLDLQDGAWDGLAERVEALAGHDQTLPEARLEADVVLGLLALSAGERHTADERLRGALNEAKQHGLIDVQPAPAAGLGRLLLTDGEPERVLAVTGPVVDLIERKGMWVWATDALVTHLDALMALEQPDAAAALSTRFIEALDDCPAPAAQASALVCQAIEVEATGEAFAAAERLEAAAVAWSKLPRPYNELLTQERRCALLLGTADRGARDVAIEVLADVQSRFDAMGATWDADRVAHVLRRHGVGVTRVWRGGRRGYGDRLSPRELEVVGLVAQGMTNRQIAQSLFLSPRTIDRHLNGAMRKLDVNTRTAVVVVAREAGLL